MKNKSKNYAIGLILLTSITSLSCFHNNDDGVNFGDSNPPVRNTNFESQEPFSFEVPVGNHTQFDLKGIGGNITITGISAASSVLITGMKRVQSESVQDAQVHLRELKVNVQDLVNEVGVETHQPQNTEGRNYIVDYTISLPNYFSINVNNLNGLVTLDSIDSDVTVNNLNGNVTLRKILGSALISLLTGTIESEVTLPLNGTIELNTLSGDINLDIPKNTSAAFSAAVSNGSINVSNLVLQNDVETSTFLSGRLGSGQGTISLEAEQFGNISVSGV